MSLRVFSRASATALILVASSVILLALTYVGEDDTFWSSPERTLRLFSSAAIVAVTAGVEREDERDRGMWREASAGRMMVAGGPGGGASVVTVGMMTGLLGLVVVFEG